MKYGQLLLLNQLKQLVKNPVDGFSVGLVDDQDLYQWQICIEGPPGTL
jgi:ubiquitin-conjugating enzyme E2 G1